MVWTPVKTRAGFKHKWPCLVKMEASMPLLRWPTELIRVQTPTPGQITKFVILQQAMKRPQIQKKLYKFEPNFLARRGPLFVRVPA